jgi:flagellar biosynthesis/type III secretory pathway protein FliH
VPDFATALVSRNQAWYDSCKLERQKMEDFDSLLDESPFVQKRKAEAEEKGIEKGIEQGQAEGLQKAVIAIVRLRFPDLTEFAQQQVVKINKPDVLDYLIEQVSIAPNETIIRQLLRPTAA